MSFIVHLFGKHFHHFGKHCPAFWKYVHLIVASLPLLKSCWSFINFLFKYTFRFWNSPLTKTWPFCVLYEYLVFLTASSEWGLVFLVWEALIRLEGCLSLKLCYVEVLWLLIQGNQSLNQFLSLALQMETGSFPRSSSCPIYPVLSRHRTHCSLQVHEGRL